VAGLATIVVAGIFLVVFWKPSAPVLPEQPPAPVLLEQPSAPVLLEQPSAPVLLDSPGTPASPTEATSQVVVALPDWPLRKSGDSGAEVSALQHLLLARGEALSVDGVFGSATKTGVQHFQGANGLLTDGIVGPATWPKLVIQVEQGSRGEAVTAVQQLLNDKFGYSQTVDGIFGPYTATAVKDFQKGHGLTVDGIVGPLTWRSLVGS